MEPKDLQKTWDFHADRDPLFEILTYREKTGKKWREKDFFKTGVEEISAVLHCIESLGLHLGRQRAMDFGCGVGRLSFALASHFDEVHGVDISPSMIRLANGYNTFGGKCVFHSNISFDLKTFEDNSFDFIYTSRVLQHIKPDYSVKYICEFFRLLRPRGILVFQLPSRELSRLSKILNSLKNGEMKRLLVNLTPQTLMNAYLYMKYRKTPRPKVEMHGIEKEVIVKLIEANNAEAIDVSVNDAAGSDWISVQYVARKR